MASFSENVKAELLRSMPEKSCCMLSELSAVTLHSGTLVLRGRGRFLMRYQASSTALAKRILILLKRRLHIVPQIIYREEKSFGRHRVIILNIEENDTRKLLFALQMLRIQDGNTVFHRMPRANITKRCCQRSYIRAAFLECGSIRDPSGGYTVEFAFPDEKRAQSLQLYLDHQSIPYHQRTRKNRYLIYIAGGDAVADLLTLMGAPVSRLAFEDQRIIRSGSAKATRATNCDTANLKRQLSGSEYTLQQIRSYLQNHDMSELPETLAETALFKLNYPYLSLEELAACFEKPLTKSGVYHRLKKLMDYIAKSAEKSGKSVYKQPE